MRDRFLCPLLISLCSVAFVFADEKVDFNKDIRPILSDKCFHCHGPDAVNQRSDFRLDSFDHAIADLGGYAGVVPGDAEGSELVARIEAADAIDVMPPPDSNRSLSDEERSLLEWDLFSSMGPRSNLEFYVHSSAVGERKRTTGEDECVRMQDRQPTREQTLK